jgi:putative Mg2+ transporter-C (MgtC) family protein
MYDWQDIALQLCKVLLAAVLGGAVGFERESHGQAAGFRTYVVVSTGACLMMLLSLHMEKIYHGMDVVNSVVRIDPGRIASYAIASMGFLGAGAIIKGRGSVRGLTTAAGLWIVTGMGLAVGAGFILQTVFTTLLVLAVLYRIHPLREYSNRSIYSKLTVKLGGLTQGVAPQTWKEQSFDAIGEVLSMFTDISVLHVNVSRSVAARTTTYVVRVCGKDENGWKDVVEKVSLLEGVQEVSWAESDVP